MAMNKQTPTMLRTKYQPEKATGSWQATIRVQRNHIDEFLNESPSFAKGFAHTPRQRVRRRAHRRGE
jgi:hypothetical protein